MTSTTVRWMIVLAALACATAGCTTVRKREGIFEATGVGVRLFTFTVPATNYETVHDAIVREVGPDAEIKTVWRSTYFRPWYNLLYPILGVETIEIYGTY